MLRESRLRTILLFAAWAIPCAVLLVAFVAIAVYTNNPWPWQEIVHESGDRTLTGTVLYFEHAARELPLDILLGIACGGSLLFAFPARKGAPAVSKRKRLGILAIATLVAVGPILLGTLHVGGVQELSDNLLQLHTRPGAPLDWGAHWRYHLLSRAFLLLLTLGLAGMVVLMVGRAGGGGRTGLLIFATTLGLYVVLTLVFVPNLEPFKNPVYLGHQVREVLTHVLVTIPMAWGVCLILAGDRSKPSSRGNASVRWPVVAGFGSLVLGSFLLVAGLMSSAASQGQTKSVILLVFPHFFEHSFTYIVVALVAGLVYELAVIVER